MDLQTFSSASIVTGKFLPILASAFELIPATFNKSVRFMFLFISMIHNRLYDHPIETPPYLKPILARRNRNVNPFFKNFSRF